MRALALLALFASVHVASADLAEPTWIAVAPTGLVYDGPSAEVAVELEVGAEANASAVRAVAAGATPLDDLVAQALFARNVTGERIVVTFRADEEVQLRVSGRPFERDGRLALRVESVDYPAESRLRPVGPVLFVVEHGWNDEVLTVAAAWERPVDGPVVVRLVARADGRVVEREAVAEPEGGAWVARFVLERLPAVLDWEATILRGGEVDGSTGARVSFPAREASGGFFTPTPGSGLVAAGGFHAVAARKVAVPVASSVLAPDFEGAAGCPESGAYDTLSGETWRIAGFARPGEGCAPAEGTAAVMDADRAAPPLPWVLAVALVGLAIVLALAWAVVGRRSRS